jgi:protein SCO1/2
MEHPISRLTPAARQAQFARAEVIMSRLLAAVVLPAVLLAAGCATRPPSEEDSDSLYQDLGKVPPFRLTDQLGRTVTRDDLLGKVWVANFFFSHCAGDCSKTNATMARLQEDLAGWPDVRLVGFSVDPEDDTPAVLRAYGARWGNDPERWLMLTGPEKQMYALIQGGFKQAVQHNDKPRPGYEVVHTFSLVIVDATGHVRGYTDGRDEAEIPRVEARVQDLVLAIYLPRIDAALNGACALLLVLGYVCVRRRLLLTHKLLMLAALALSVVFLACYLFYHIVVQRGHSTPFGGEGLVRPVYYAVLVSHVVLAAVVTPLALRLAWLGLRNRLAGHVRLARWTLPLWLYVSITGVVVYWMLYHLYPPA